MAKKLSKNITGANAKVDKNKIYSIEEAIKAIKEASFEKFDTSIEVSFNLNLDTTKAEQQLRGAIILPNGTGKVTKVLVIADPDDLTKAKTAGADETGSLENLGTLIKDNKLNFDYIVTTPSTMPQLAKFGKELGPKGLMPNPKIGTVAEDVAKAVENIKKGQVEYRTNNDGLINLSIGKKSFSDEAILENFKTIYDLIKGKKPLTIKGEYILGISVATSMGPGVKVKK